MSDTQTPEAVVAPEAVTEPVPVATPVVAATDDTLARLSSRLDRMADLEKKLAEMEKRETEARVSALIKAHEDKFLPAHLEDARTIAAAYPEQFARLMGAARAVRPGAGSPMVVRNASDTVRATGLSTKDAIENPDAQAALAAAAKEMAAREGIPVMEAARRLNRAA